MPPSSLRAVPESRCDAPYSGAEGTSPGGPLAQLVEQLAFNQLVVGSNPTRPTNSSIKTIIKSDLLKCVLENIGPGIKARKRSQRRVRPRRARNPKINQVEFSGPVHVGTSWRRPQRAGVGQQRDADAAISILRGCASRSNTTLARTLRRCDVAAIRRSGASGRAGGLPRSRNGNFTKPAGDRGSRGSPQATANCALRRRSAAAFDARVISRKAWAVRLRNPRRSGISCPAWSRR